MKIDLHTHTTFSDGQLTPEKLVQLALKKKVTHLSVTDHDTLASLCTIREHCQEAGIAHIPGIEISCQCEGEEVHLLAYYIQEQDPEFLQFLEEQKQDRFLRVENIIRKLNEQGVLLEKKDIEPYMKETKTPGRPHVAQALIRLGYVPNIKEAFRVYLAPDRPGYVPRQFPEATLVIEKIKRNGGVSSLAHPGLLRNRTIPERLRDQGLQGIEAYHPSHKRSEMKALAFWADQNRLIVTGGSDFHGFKGERNAALGSLPVPAETMDKLREAARGGQRRPPLLNQQGL